MRHHLLCFASCISVYVAATGGCTPTERNYGGEGLSGGGGQGGGASSSSSSGSAGAGGAACAPSTADCNMDGTCETNLLGDRDHCGECNMPCIPPMGGTSDCVGGKCVYSCAAGTFDCDMDPSTVCQEVQSDSKHCGACGHDCLGGACMQGQCQPTMAFNTGMVTISPPVSLAVFGSEIHWGTLGGEIARAGIDGSNATLRGNVNGPAYGLAVTSNGVYATNGNRITIFLGMGAMWQSINDPGVNALAANDQHVVWTATGPGRIRRAEVLGGNQKDFANFEMGPTNIVLEGDIARWTNSNTGDVRESLVFENGVVTTLFTGPSGARFLVQDKNVLYWIANDTVFRGVLGGSSEPLFPTGPDVRAFVVDQNHFYWTLGGPGEVRRAAKTPPFEMAVVAAGQPEPSAMVLGADSVFWANRADGTIMRLAR